MQADDMYAIAAQAQRMPGFGLATDGGPLVRGQLQCASIVSRLVASFVDGMITGIGAVVIVVGLLFADVLTGGDPRQSQGVGTLLIILAAMIAFLWLYHVAQETSAAQATLGKRLMGIKVANLSGGRISVPQATIRFFARMVPGVNPMLALANFLGNIVCLVMNSSTNRTIHDLIAGTVVIRG
jgi:uncharacterized RDD family membrane protein YckC